MRTRRSRAWAREVNEPPLDDEFRVPAGKAGDRRGKRLAARGIGAGPPRAGVADPVEYHHDAAASERRVGPPEVAQRKHRRRTRARLLAYFSLLPDRRLMFGGRGDTTGSPSGGEAMRRLLTRRMGQYVSGIQGRRGHAFVARLYRSDDAFDACDRRVAERSERVVCVRLSRQWGGIHDLGRARTGAAHCRNGRGTARPASRFAATLSVAEAAPMAIACIARARVS